MQSLVWAGKLPRSLIRNLNTRIVVADRKFGIVGFSGLRTLALSGINWTLASTVFILAACPFGVNMVRPPLHPTHRRLILNISPRPSGTCLSA